MAESTIECPSPSLATTSGRARLAGAALSSGRRAEAGRVPAATIEAGGEVLGRFALTLNEPGPDELARLGLVAVGWGGTADDGFGTGRWM